MVGLKSSANAILGLVAPRTRVALVRRLYGYMPWERAFDPTPPPPGQGEIPGPPNFVGIGAQKAGTTWWHHLIESHPEVYTRPKVPKELHYVSRFGTRALAATDRARYEGWFARPPGTIAGEWTPDYFYCGWAASRLKAVAPDARLLLILRDPVDRLHSGLTHRPVQAKPNAHVSEATAAAVNRSFYDRQLELWLSYFPRDQILVLQYEQCASDPSTQLGATYRFLGIDDSYRPPDLEARVGYTRREKVPLDDEARKVLVEIFTPDVIALAKRLPELDLSLWPNFADLGSG